MATKSWTKNIDLDKQKNDLAVTGPRFGVRHIQIILLFSINLYSYATRMVLSVAIVAMTDSNTTSNPDIPTYDWDNKSVVLSSFFWGYITLLPFMGQIVKMYGPKWFLVAMIVINSSACIAVPFMAAEFGSGGVMACRVLQGIVQGALFPSCHTLLGKWVPPSERSALGAFGYAGVPLGTITGMAVTGWISASWVGWPLSFYAFASFGFVCLIPLILFGSNKPSDHRSISYEERNYIESSLGTEAGKPQLPTPWKDILTSGPLWTLAIGNIGVGWGNGTLLTELPNYMNKVMKFDMHSNGPLSAAPYAVQFCFHFIFGPISDYIINHNYLSRGMARKVFQSIGVGIPAIALTILAFIPEDANALSIILLLIAVGVNSAVNCGIIANMIDLSPNFSGVIMGLVNCIGNFPAVIAPLLVQIVVTDETNKYQWRIIFLVTSAIYVVTGAIYFIFGSAKIQHWNEAIYSKVKKENDETSPASYV